MVKIQAIKAGLNLFRTRTVSANSKRLFSFAKKHKFKMEKGTLSEDGLILTHLSNHAPRNGFIDTARSGAGQTRDSVHFAVNHGVAGHAFGNWGSSEYAVLIPMRAARQAAGNKFVGGVAADFYSKGRVRIPKGSVIVRRSANIPEGKYRISDVSKIKKFKELHGVKVIETSSKDMVSEVNNIVRRLGYKMKSSDVTTWGGSLSDFKLFNSYLKANGMKPMIHTNTPNGKTEMIIEHINYRAKKLTDWTVKDKSGGVIVDYKQEYLQALKYIDKFAKRTGFPKDFDTKQLAEIIKSSSTPKEAVQLIEKRLKIKPMASFSKNISEFQSFQYLRTFGSGNKPAEISDNLACEFLKNPNKTNLLKFQQGPVAIDTVPDAVIQQAPGIKDAIIRICKQNGIKFDNTVANKLYELG